MLFNSTIWTCSISGRPNLTYAEALESEKKHRRVIDAFPQVLKGPVVFLANLTKRSAISDLVDDVFNYVNTRYFKNEHVQAAIDDGDTYADCEVIGFNIVPVNGGSPNGKLNPEDLNYRVRQIGDKTGQVFTVTSDNIRRKKKDPSSLLTKDKLKLFLKQCIEYNDIRMLTIKRDIYKKYVEDANITSLASFFVGKAPVFELSKALADKKEKEKKEKNKEKVKKEKVAKEPKEPKEKTPKPKKEKKPKAEKLENGNGKSPAANGKGKASKADKNGKQPSISQFMTKDEKKEKSKPSAADLEKAKQLAEEMARLRKLKEAEDAERQKKLAEEREKMRQEMMLLVSTTVKNLNAIKDDLQLQDQKPLPLTKPVQTLIPQQYFPDAIMIQEIICSYTNCLEDKDKFRNGIHLALMERALLAREVAGPLSDILQVLLGSIFSFQIEEHNEVNFEYERGRINFKDATPPVRQAIIQDATSAARWSTKYLNAYLFELPIDATTLSELLRIHFLMAGARMSEACARHQLAERGGYQSQDDPGLYLREQHPHILKALASKTVYELPTRDIMIILKCLIDQLMTYATIRDAIEDRMEKSNKSKMLIKSLIIAERKREIQVEKDKKEVVEEIKRSLEAFVGTDEEKTAYREKCERDASAKIVSIEHYAEKEKAKFLAELETLRREVFDYQLFLGSDRAYRSYWLFESLPGLFVEHLPFGGKCLEKPIDNIPGLANCPAEKRYMFIKNMLHEKHGANTNNSNASNDKENKISNMLEVKPKVNAGEQSTVDGSNNGLSNGIGPAEPVINEVAEIKREPTVSELLMCTADENTCLVHRKDHPERVTWSFLSTEEELNALIDSLNPRGLRERMLREQLESQKELILFHIKNCPTEKLQVREDQTKEALANLFDERDKTYANANFNHPKDTDIGQIMHLEIRTNILELEYKLTNGQLGTMKVNDLQAWRSAIENDDYDMQCESLEWGPENQYHEGKSQSNSRMKQCLIYIYIIFSAEKGGVQMNGFDKKMTNGKMTNGSEGGDHEDGSENEEEAEEEEEEANSDAEEEESVDLGVYRDPGAGLKTIKTENGTANSEDLEQYRKRVHQLASALLQIGQGVDPKYFKPPFGSLKAGKNGKEAALVKAKQNFDMWCVSLMNAINISQLFLHYNVLYDAIKWTRSAQNARCVCRSNRDPDKLILCDGCNLGRHIYCLKPKLTVRP